MIGTYLTEPIFGDAEIKQAFSDSAMTRAMLQVEAQLARTQSNLGIVPGEHAETIRRLAEDLAITPEVLAEGVGAAGVPVPALVSALRTAVGQPAADFVHYGATSQDIVDTATVLCIRDALAVLADRINQLLDTLARQSQTHRATLMLARTRGQLATPTTAGLRIAQWASPLIELEAEMLALKPKVLKVQFGGASGNCTAVGADAAATSKGLADALGLADAPPWHTDRSALHALASWLMRAVSACGKIGADTAISARGEVSEMQAGVGGGSSTMPHKSNPVTAEALQSIALAANASFGGFTASAAHLEERDGVNWAAEWLFLPQLFILTGAAVSTAGILASTLKVNETAMLARITKTPGVMSEAAVFALAHELGRTKAGQEVKAAMADGGDLGQALTARGYSHIDWDAALDPASVITNSAAIADRIWARRG